jgi:mRNA interferase MazF
MKRGEVWLASGGGDYTGKPRPILIVQDDQFDATALITICAFTTDPTEAPLFRLPVTPSDHNGLNEPCGLMIDKISTIPKAKLGHRIGRIGDDDDVLRLNRAILVFLGLADSSRRQTTQ